MKEMGNKNKIIIAVVCVAVVLFGAILLFMKGNGVKRVSISGLKEQLPDGAPAELLQNIEKNVYDQLKADSGKDNDGVSGAVRNGSSLVFEVYDKRHSGKLIVDLEAAKQSYMVYYSYTDGVKLTGGDMGEFNGAILFCLSNSDDVIYTESACNKRSTIPDQEVLYTYLPDYKFKLDDGKDVRLTFSAGKEVTAVVDQCNTVVDKNAIIAKAKEVVAGYGFEADDFKYSVPLSFEDCLIK